MLVCNGYEVAKGNGLKYFKLALLEMNIPERHFGNIAKRHQLGIVDFRTAVINEEMDSEQLKLKILEAISKDEPLSDQEL